jgi:hypothetical protein
MSETLSTDTLEGGAVAQFTNPHFKHLCLANEYLTDSLLPSSPHVGFM